MPSRRRHDSEFLIIAIVLSQMAAEPKESPAGVCGVPREPLCYTYTVQTTSGAYVRFPKVNSMLAIKGIALHGSTSLKFSYRKDSANECITVLSYKFSDTSSWTELDSSAETGVITHEFTIENPESKTIDIQVKNISPVTDNKWPVVDDWRLVALD